MAKTFPMSTFVSYIKEDAKDQAVVEMLSFMTGKDIDAEFQPFAAALAKSWIYEQHPEIASMKTGDVAGLGDKVSMNELPAEVLTEVDGIFNKLAEYHSTISEQGEKVQDLEKKLAEAEAKLAESEKGLATYKGKCEALEASAKDEGDQLIVASGDKVSELNESVKTLASDIDAVKASIVAILQAAPTGEGGAAAAPAAAGAPEAGGEPGSDFGFGSDPFSDDAW